MVHVVAACCRAPFGVVLQQLDIEPIATAGRLDVKGALADLLDGADPRQGQEETKVNGKVGASAGERLARGQVFGFEVGAISCQDKFRLGLGCCRAGLQLGKGICDLSFGANLQMDFIGLKHTALVGLVSCAFAQHFDGRGFVAKCE